MVSERRLNFPANHTSKCRCRAPGPDTILAMVICMTRYRTRTRTAPLVLLLVFASPLQNVRSQAAPAPPTPARPTSPCYQDPEGDETWIAARQALDGSWGKPVGAGIPDQSVGVTSLVVLTFLASGHTPELGRHKQLVGRALGYLAARQDTDTGRVSAPEADDLEHILATLSLCEAAGATQDATRIATAERAVSHLITLQDSDGRWHAEASSHATAWALLALVNARKHDLDVADLDAAMARARGALETEIVQPASATAKPLTRAALPNLVGLVMLDSHWVDTPEGKHAFARLPDLSNQPLLPGGDTPPRLEDTFWTTCALYAAHDVRWRAWELRLLHEFMLSSAAPTPTQHHVKHNVWDPHATPGLFGTCEDATALGALVLTIFYRYDGLLTDALW